VIPNPRRALAVAFIALADRNVANFRIVIGLFFGPLPL
jgi:hypothetical protein